MAKQVVLVVDDDDSTRRYLGAVLSSLGYQVEDVGIGRESPSAAWHEHPRGRSSSTSSCPG